MGDVDATDTTPTDNRDHMPICIPRETDTGGSENEDFMPFLETKFEARGWKIVTIILLAYWAIRALDSSQGTTPTRLDRFLDVLLL